jgi:alpha-beta hydrolase superfamily lysophospholipase
MRKEEFIVKSDFDGLELIGEVFEPSETPKGVIQFVHGMCEHKGRYEDMASYFTNNGYICVIYDQRGHGRTAKTKEDLGYFGDKTGRGIVEDAYAVTREIKRRYPNLPVILFGHSMGSMVVRCYLQDHDDMIDKLIVCGSPSFNPLVDVAIGLTRVLGSIKGEKHRSKTLAYISTGRGNKNFPNEGPSAWLSRNRENISNFANDEYCKYIFTYNGFENLFRLMKSTFSKKEYKLKNPNLPIHFVSGSEDAVLGGEDNWLKIHNSLREIGYKNVSGKLYHGLRHEVHNEPEQATVYADLLAFIEEK